MLKLRNSILFRFVGSNDMTACTTQVSKAVLKKRTAETVETKQTMEQKKSNMPFNVSMVIKHLYSSACHRKCQLLM